MEDTRKTRPTKSTKQVSYRLIVTEAISMETARFCSSSPAHYVIVDSVGLLIVCMSLTLAWSWECFLPLYLPCPTSIWGLFTLSYCILFSPVWLLFLGGLFFSEGKQRGGGSGGEGMWRELGGRMGNCNWDVLYEKKKKLFSIKKKNLGLWSI